MEEVAKQEAGKIKKRYENDLKKLTLILGGDFLFAPLRLANSEVVEAVKELAKEEREKMVKSFKERAIQAIQKQREHLKHVENLKKEFEKKQEESMKDFSKTVEGLFKDLNDIKNIEKDYLNILMGEVSIDKETDDEENETQS